MQYEVIEDLEAVIYEALEEAFNMEGQAYNGTFLRMWAVSLVESFKGGDAIDPDFDGSICTRYF